LKVVVDCAHDAITIGPNIAQDAAEPSASYGIFQRRSGRACLITNMTGKKMPAGESGRIQFFGEVGGDRCIMRRRRMLCQFSFVMRCITNPNDGKNLSLLSSKPAEMGSPATRQQIIHIFQR
jgi:hypothetical protein